MEKKIRFTYNKKKVEELNEQRATLLALNEKVRLTDGLESEDLKRLLETCLKIPCNEGNRGDYMAAELGKRWLVEITVGADLLLRVKDLAQSENWIAEGVENVIGILERAFGACSYEIVNSYFGMQVLADGD